MNHFDRQKNVELKGISDHKISIITVSYNAANTIEQTIASVVEQTYDNIEYIIIDGHSTDDTVKIIKRYEGKIAYWITEPDKGIYDAMNKGIMAATGDYIHFLNADDCFVDNETIARIIAELNDDVELLSSPIWFVDEQYAMQRLIKNKVTNEMILSGVMIPHPGILVRADIMKQHLFSLNYKIACDYEFLLKCVLEKRIIKYVNVPLVYFSNEGISNKFTNLCDEETTAILYKYNVPQQYINAFLNRTPHYITTIIRTYVRNAIKAVNLYRVFSLKRGWQMHKCSNPLCRWCLARF